MAQNNFKIFDQNKVNLQSDTDYANNTQRLNGVRQGIASSSLNNKALYQTSTMAAAVAGFINDNGQDATDSDMIALKNNYSAALTNFSNGVNSVIDSYPVSAGVSFSAGDPVDIVDGTITVSKSERDGLKVIANDFADVIYQFDALHLYASTGTTITQYTLTDGSFSKTASYTYESGYDTAEIVSLCKYNDTVLFAAVKTHSNTSNTIDYNVIIALNVGTSGVISYISVSDEITSIASSGSYRMQSFVGGSILMSQAYVGSAPSVHVLTYPENIPTISSSGVGSHPVLLNGDTVLATAITSSTTTPRIIFNFYEVAQDGTLALKKYNTTGTVRETDFQNVMSTPDDKLAVISSNSARLGHLYTVNYTDWSITEGASIPDDPLLYAYTSCYPTTTRTIVYRSNSNTPYTLYNMTFSSGVTYTSQTDTNFSDISPYTYYAGISDCTPFVGTSKTYALYNYKPGASSSRLGFAQTATITISSSKDAIAMQDSSNSPCKVCYAGAVKIDGVSDNTAVITPGVSMQTYTDGRCIIYNANAVPYKVQTFTGDGNGQRSIDVGFLYSFIIETETSKIILGNGTMSYVPTSNENGTEYIYIAFR